MPTKTSPTTEAVMRRDAVFWASSARLVPEESNALLAFDATRSVVKKHAEPAVMAINEPTNGAPSSTML